MKGNNMKIYNAKVFIDKEFISGGVEFNERFTAAGKDITSGDIDAKGAYLIPGLIDIHTHAAMGEDASDGKAKAFPVMGRYYAKGGVTSWCPTTMTLKEPVLTDAMHAIRSYSRPKDAAKIAGVNLEGPFLSYAKRGAQNADNLHAPDIDMFNRLNEASGGIVRLVTVAPEEPGAIPFIKAVSKTCTISLGHTTADYDTAMAAYDAGASHATHLFNAMPSLLHRAPGVVGAAFDSGATAELICDGLHIHPGVIRLTHSLFGDDLVLISDSLRCAGMPDGDYMLGGQPITMKNGKATLKDSDTLAGSCIHLMDAVKNAVRFGLPLEDAVYAATAAPARVIRMAGKIGAIATDMAADFVLLDKELNVKAVFIDGIQI